LVLWRALCRAQPQGSAQPGRQRPGAKRQDRRRHCRDPRPDGWLSQQARVDATEFARATDGNIRGLPNRYETNGQVLGALVSNQLLGRPDDYQATLPTRYRAIDRKAIDDAARAHLQPDGLVIVVVGDRKSVEPQLKGLGLPVELLSPVDSGQTTGE